MNQDHRLNPGNDHPQENQMTGENEKQASIGWDAITAEFERIYPGQTDPKHYATLIPWSLGGNDPLQGVSIYDGGDYWHFVSYGLTELNDKISPNLEVSGFGYEMTMKLKKADFADEELELKNVVGILQTIARITVRENELFGPYEFIATGQEEGMDTEQASVLTGLITVPDSLARSLDTPNGSVNFLSLIGVSNPELKTLSTHDSVKDLYRKLGTDVTDYKRASLY